MPLRDHFHPPMSLEANWESFHGGWPMVIVQSLNRTLPPQYIAEPRVHLGDRFEVDIAASERSIDAGSFRLAGTALAWAPARPTQRLKTALPDAAEYEVLVYDIAFDRKLVAAIEIVSPSNKDRPKHRRDFVNKCETLLHKGISIIIIDIVTCLAANLFRDVLKRFDGNRPKHDGPIYATSCLSHRDGTTFHLDTWEHALKVGKPLPSLPLWLNDELPVPIAFEETYSTTLRDLRLA